MFKRGVKPWKASPSSSINSAEATTVETEPAPPSFAKPILRRSSSSPSGTTAKVAKSVASSFRWLPGNRKQQPVNDNRLNRPDEAGPVQQQRDVPHEIDTEPNTDQKDKPKQFKDRFPRGVGLKMRSRRKKKAGPKKRDTDEQEQIRNNDHAEPTSSMNDSISALDIAEHSRSADEQYSDESKTTSIPITTFERRKSKQPPTIEVSKTPTTTSKQELSCGVGSGLAKLDHDADMFSSDQKFVESSVHVDEEGNVVDNYGFVVTPASHSSVSPASASMALNGAQLEAPHGLQSERNFRKRQLRMWTAFKQSLGEEGFNEIDSLGLQRWRRHNTGVEEESIPSGSRPTSPVGRNPPVDECNLECHSESDTGSVVSPTSGSTYPPTHAPVVSRNNSSNASGQHSSGAEDGGDLQQNRRLSYGQKDNTRKDKGEGRSSNGSTKSGKSSGRLKSKLKFAANPTPTSPRTKQVVHSNTRLKSFGSHLSRAVSGANLRMRRSASANVPGVSFGDSHSRQHITHLVRAVGIPPQIRSELWLKFSGAEEKMAKASESESYQALLTAVEKEEPESASVIERDLRRTFPTNSHFKDESVIGSLRRVLLAYSIRNPNVGYCQSMNFLVAILLLHLEELQTFWVLCAIVEDLIPGYYTRTMTCMHTDQHVLSELVQRKLPKLYAHLNTLDFRLETTTYSWFLCLFVNSLSLESTLRVWDCFLHEGYKALFRISLAILKILQKQLLAMDSFQEVHELLSTVPRLISPQKLLKVAYDPYFLGQFSSASILQLRAQFRPSVEEALNGLTTWTSFSSSTNFSSSNSTLDVVHERCNKVEHQEDEEDLGPISASVLANEVEHEEVNPMIPVRPSESALAQRNVAKRQSDTKEDRLKPYQYISDGTAIGHREPVTNSPRSMPPSHSRSSKRAPRRLSTSTGFTYSYSLGGGSPPLSGGTSDLAVPRLVLDGSTPTTQASRPRLDVSKRSARARSIDDLLASSSSLVQEPEKTFGFDGGERDSFHGGEFPTASWRLSLVSNPSDVTEGDVEQHSQFSDNDDSAEGNTSADLGVDDMVFGETHDSDEDGLTYDNITENTVDEKVPVRYSERLQSLAFVMNAKQDPAS